MYSKEVKDIVLKVYKNLKRESSKGSLFCKVKNPIGRTSCYTGIGRSTIKRWLKRPSDDDVETDDDGQATDPPQFKKLDSFDIDQVVRSMKEMIDQRQVITIKRLQTLLSQKYDMDVKKTTLWKVMKAKGFTYTRTQGNRKQLCERPDLQVARCAFLRKIYDIRNSGTFNIVYLDESYVNANHTYPKEWVSTDRNTARQIPTGKGQRLILLHAIGELSTTITDTGDVEKEYGFLPGCELLYKSLSTDNRDYHTEMNHVVFEHWVEYTLLPSLQEPTCIVLDNATYHSREWDPAPTMASTKEKMKEWLREKSIPFNEGLLKPELYALIKVNKPEKEYVVDRLLKKHGHLVLRLPPYHCDLNPIEDIWGIIKNFCARNNTTFKLDDMRVLIQQAIQDITPVTIKNTMDHVRDIEQQYWERDGLSISPVIANFTIDLGSSSESDSSDDDSE